MAKSFVKRLNDGSRPNTACTLPKNQIPAMNETPAPKRHRKTRADHASEVAEDYVEAIADIAAARGVCRAVDLATRFGVSSVTVNRTIAGWFATGTRRPSRIRRLN